MFLRVRQLALGHAHTARGARHPPLRYRQGDRHGWPVLRANLARRARMSAGSSTRRSKSKLLQIDTECSNRTTPDQSWVRWLARGDETLRRGLDHVFVHKTVSRPLDRVPDRRHGRAAADATDPEDRRGGCRCCGAARCRDATGASAAERQGAAGQAAGPPVGAPLLIESQRLGTAFRGRTTSGSKMPAALVRPCRDATASRRQCGGVRRPGVDG